MTWPETVMLHNKFRVPILPVTRCLRVFIIFVVQKKRLSIFNWIFSHWIVMGDRKIDLKVTDMEIPRHKFYSILLLNINCRKFHGDSSLSVAMSYDEHSNFSGGEVTWRDLFTWPWGPGSEIFTCAKKCINRCAKNSDGGQLGGKTADVFRHLRKTRGGWDLNSKHPRPGAC